MKKDKTKLDTKQKILSRLNRRTYMFKEISYLQEHIMNNCMPTN